MADIFLCYAREDGSRVERLVRALETHGWSVFFDQRIRTGQEWRNHIDQELDDARCVVVAWSRQSVRSNWVIDEADEGKQRKVLVPILLDPIEPPKGFRGLQTTDLADWHPGQPSPRFEQLVKDIRALLEGPQPPPRVPLSPPLTPHRLPWLWSVLTLLLLLVLVAGGVFGYRAYMEYVASNRQAEPSADKPTAEPASVLTDVFAQAGAKNAAIGVDGYTQAFDEASAAGNRLYDEVSAVITRTQAEADAKAEAELAAGVQAGEGVGAILPAAGPSQAAVAEAICPTPTVPPQPYRTCFVPSDFVPGGMPGEPDGLVARRRALATITTFATIALRLASGETASALGAEVQKLGANASSLAALTGAGAAVAPLIGVSADLAADLATWAESLRADQELRAALAIGSPLIEALLEALIADTQWMYAFKREEIAERLVALKADGQRAALDLKSIVANHAPFATLASIDRRYMAARGRISGLPFESLTALAGSRGAAPLDTASAERLDGFLISLETIAAGYDAQVVNRYYAALGEYVGMLRRSSEALQLVAASAGGPQTVTIDPASLASRATDIRDRAREIERLLEI